MMLTFSMGLDECLVHDLTVDLELEDVSVDLVDEKNWSDLLLHGLSEHGFSLDADSFDGIDDDQSTIGDSESCSDFRREVDVSWGVDQVEEIASPSYHFLLASARSRERHRWT
jgi:hypothetical protein